MNQEQITALAQKLKALAEKADGNEQALAQQKLNELLSKYNLAESDLEDKADYHEFKYKKSWEETLLRQIGYKVLNSTEAYHTKPAGRKLQEVIFKCTDAQSLEIEYLYSFYKALFEKDLESFLQAFIQKHQLFGTADTETVNHPTLSEEEIFRQAAFQHGMSEARINKAIEQKG